MRYITHFILISISLLVFATCTFADSGQKTVNTMNAVSTNNRMKVGLQLGDSITVDTIIGEYKLFYRVSDVIDTIIVSSSCNEEVSTREVKKVDKTILLNIQRNDSTSVVTYQTLTIDDFDCVISKVKELDYQIESFYLKEVAQNSIIFGAKLCKFGTDICRDIDIFIDKNGSLNYFLLENTYTEN